MKFLCNDNNITPRLKYTVDFIFSTLGFTFEIIPLNKFRKTSDLVFGYLNQDEIDSFRNENIINIFNSNELKNMEEFEKKIELKKIDSENIPILGSTFQKDSNSNWIKSRKENYFYSKKFKMFQIEYDLISNVFYHLSRFEERWKIFADEKEADWTKSVLSKADNLNVPVIDILLNELKNIIYIKSKKENVPVVRILPWPNAAKFAVTFTHDVDITRGYSAKEFITSKSKSILYSILNQKQKKEKIKNELDDKNSTVWSYIEILDFYKKKNWNATFFFIAKVLEGTHLRYDTASKKFKNLFKDLTENGHEIALHPSLKAFDNPKDYHTEKKMLEKDTNLEILGMRQHYLRFKTPRIWNLASIAKLKYDSSLGYNYRAGFRAGTSNCFLAFDYKDDQEVDVLEIPITFFEYNLPNKGQDEKQSKDVIEKLVSQIEKYEGLLNVLIHPSNFLISPFKEYWEFLIKQIEKKKIFTVTLSELTNWIKHKRSIKLAYTSGKNKLTIEISKPKTVKSLSLELSRTGEFEESKSVSIKKITSGKFVLHSSKTKLLLTYNLN